MKKKVLHRTDLTPRIGVVVGTRPGIIKFSPVIKELMRRDLEFVLVHTGQHYSPSMDSDFFETLELPQPHFANEETSAHSSHATQTAAMMVGVEEALLESRPATFVVGGDANTNFAAAVAVRKLVAIELAHMEAGLRSGDWSMPEEHNRVMIDHISEVLFAPTETAIENLRQDAVSGEVLLTGNTIVDAVMGNLEVAKVRSGIRERLGLEEGGYAVVTMHREENVDHPDVVRRMIEVLRMLDADLGMDLVFPMHPRTRNRFQSQGVTPDLERIEGLHLLDPVDYLDMLHLMDGAHAIFTDSGGIQEEACILQTPCITLRENTERPETLDVGANRLGGSSPQRVAEGLEYFRSRPSTPWKVPYGDGKAARRIVDRLQKTVDALS